MDVFAFIVALAIVVSLVIGAIASWLAPEPPEVPANRCSCLDTDDATW